MGAYLQPQSPRFYTVWANRLSATLLPGLPNQRTSQKPGTYNRLIRLKPRPFLHREICQIRIFLEHFADIHVGMVLEGLRDATVYVFPAREPLDFLALCLRLARSDGLLEGNLFSLGQLAASAGPGINAV